MRLYKFFESQANCNVSLLGSYSTYRKAMKKLQREWLEAYVTGLAALITP